MEERSFSCPHAAILKGSVTMEGSFIVGAVGGANMSNAFIVYLSLNCQSVQRGRDQEIELNRVQRRE